MKWFLELFKFRFSTPYQKRESKFKLATLAILAVLTTIVIWVPYRWLSDPGEDQIRLQINSAKDLVVEAPVIMQGLEIGNVESIGLADGQAVAMLQIAGEWFDEIPAGSKFYIGSLNTLLPGNVGVLILPPDQPSDQPIAMIDGVRSETVSDQILPRQTPLGLYLAILAAALVFAVALGIAFKIAKSNWIFNGVAAIILAGVAFYFTQGAIPMPTLKEQLAKLPQSAEDVKESLSQSVLGTSTQDAEETPEDETTDRDGNSEP